MKHMPHNNLTPEFQLWLKTEQEAAHRHRQRIIAIISIITVIGLFFYIKKEMVERPVKNIPPSQAIEKMLPTG